MRFNSGFRVGRGTYVGVGGGGAVGAVLGFALLGGILRMMLLLIVFVLMVIILIGVHFMNQARLKKLLAKSIDPSAVRLEGNYTNPKTWGVYQVLRLVDGRRCNGFHIGNHPVRLQELIRQHGEAQLISLHDVRIDAEEVAYLLNGGRRIAK